MLTGLTIIILFYGFCRDPTERERYRSAPESLPVQGLVSGMLNASHSAVLGKEYLINGYYYDYDYFIPEGTIICRTAEP